MNAERLLQLYDRVSEAPDAIPRLRRFVMDLAVRGKLVEQDPEDEPAPLLLKAIFREKKRLIADGVIRNPRSLAEEHEAIGPFQLPPTWLWTRLDTVGAIIGGGTPPAGDSTNFIEPGGGIPWLTPADLGGYDKAYISRGSRDLTEKGLASSSATLMPIGAVLFTSRAPIGYVAIASNPLATNQGFKSIVPYVGECSRYIAVAMRAFAPEIDASAPGTTFKEVSGKIVAGIPFPLPPLAEQHRIVAKVDALMALLDCLEAERGQREAIRDKLTTASFYRLTAPETGPEDFKAQADFAINVLPELTTRPAHIKVLRQTILDLAVRGKLVEQDPNDEPASALLVGIAEEIQEHRRRRNIRHRSKLPGLVLADRNQDPPETWCQMILGDLAIVTDPNPSHRYPEYSGGVVPILSTQNFSGERGWDATNAKLTTEEFWESQRELCNFESRDIIFARKGRLGLPRFLPTMERFTFSHTLFVIKPMKGVLPEFLLMLLERNCTVEWLTNAMNQNTGVPTLGKATLEHLPIALPPFSEQHRIIAEVDVLLTICSQLSHSLTSERTLCVRLLDVLLDEVLLPLEEKAA